MEIVISCLLNASTIKLCWFFESYLFFHCHKFFPNMIDTGKVDVVMNVVERPGGGFSAGGGISSG